MKYTVLATEHREGSFTAKSGKDAGQVKNYNFFRLHKNYIAQSAYNKPQRNF